MDSFSYHLNSGHSSARSSVTWNLEDAAMQFNKVVRQAQQNEPQYIMCDGKNVAVVIGADEYHRLNKSGRTGQSLIDALQASPFPEVLIEPVR